MRPAKKRNRRSTCHPRLPHYARGLCSDCWHRLRNRELYRIAKDDPVKNEKLLAKARLAKARARLRKKLKQLQKNGA